MQTNPINIRSKTRVVMSLTLACFLGGALAAPSAAVAQDRSQDRRDDHSQDRRVDPSQDRRGDHSQDTHGDSQGQRRRDRDESRVRFTHSNEERRFDNGVTLHRSTAVADHRFDVYFPHHYMSYPHYALSRDAGRVVVSPFSFYVGVFPPYVDRTAVVISAPSHVYIDVPIYLRGEYRPGVEGRDPRDVNRDSDDTRWKDDRDLSNAVYDIEDTFRNEDIGLLAPLTDPRTNIAIFTRGRYQYSLNSNDYLDMTRDFLRNVHTTEFIADRVHRKSGSVYQVFARQTYQDQDGKSRSVDMCIVLERIRNRWTVTQIDTTPGRFGG